MSKPSAGPKRPKETKPKGVPVFRVTYDGKTFDVSADTESIPSRVRRELFAQTGLTLDGMKKAMSIGQIDTFMVVAFIFVARREAGDAISYEQIEDAFDAEKLEGAEIVEDPDAPEA